MNVFKRIGWNLTAIAMASMVELETREKERRLQEKLNRTKQKYPNKYL
jgi:hypothetical protein